ncbi:hypothetical protein HZ994_09290 [Akkermansiaceae bacterium]|nr:hypothetical protein HZ994_09290 [Akkermansiaceae bacterium]
MIKFAPKTILCMINWWILVLIVLFGFAFIFNGGLGISNRIGGGLAFLIACLVFQGLRVFRIVRRLPDRVDDADIVEFFRADFAHRYFSIKDIVSGILELSSKDNNKANKAEMATPRKPSD